MSALIKEEMEELKILMGEVKRLKAETKQHTMRIQEIKNNCFAFAEEHDLAGLKHGGIVLIFEPKKKAKKKGKKNLEKDIKQYLKKINQDPERVFEELKKLEIKETVFSMNTKVKLV